MDPEIAAVVAQLQVRLDALPAASEHRRAFLGTYLRTTAAVGRAVAAGEFEDSDWVRRWDVVFAGYFLAAHDADVSGAAVPRPWRLAFAADPARSAMVHLLVELDAHLNWDLPQAMLDVVSDDDAADPAVLASRQRDHERINAVLAARVTAEGHELSRQVVDRLLIPARRWSTSRFLPAARRLAWHNVGQLQQARLAGPTAYAARLAELDVLASAKVADLLVPGPVLLRLALTGFGVRLPPAV